MQSNAARAGVAAVAVAVVVVLFIVLSGGGDGDQTTSPAATSAETTTDTTGQGTEPAPKPAEPAEPPVAKIKVVGGEPAGGVQDLTYSKGDEVRLQVSSDVDEEIHVHGYDLSTDVAAGGKAEIDFTADIDGVFEIELEHSAVQIAQLTVNP